MNAKRTTSIADDPDAAPRFTRVMAKRAEHAIGDTILKPAHPPLRRGRPAKAEADRKERVTMRLDKDVVAKFKATGRGWQTRINEALKKAVLAEHL